MTDRERLEQFAADLPGDTAAYEALTKRLHEMLAPYRVAVVAVSHDSRAFANHGDGTVDAKTWGHVRNLARALQELAFVLGALERGDDPDIPF